MTHDKNKPADVTITTKTDANNRDPLTGAPGAHPVGTGLGAATGAAGGAIAGAVAGPIGSVAGAAIGAVVGGLAGKSVAEAVDPTVEETYWRTNFQSAPYVKKDHDYNDYAPAYKLGWERGAASNGRPFADAESDLGRDWDAVKGTSRLSWENARSATQDAWQRTTATGPGASCSTTSKK